MLVAFLIMLREGIEAALIVGIVAGYLARTGRRRDVSAVWIGALAAAAICLALGLALDWLGAEFPQKQQELFEGVVALIAAGMLVSMVMWMRRAGRSIRGELEASVDRAAGARHSGLALAAVAFLAVGREGLESVFFLLATFQQDVGWGVPAGALLGLTSAILVGLAIYKGGVRLDLRRFFRWTGVFIIFVAAGLVASAVRSLHEAGLWNLWQQTAFVLDDVLPADGIPGTLLSGIFGYRDAPSVSEVVAYLVTLVPMLVLFLWPAPRAAMAAAEVPTPALPAPALPRSAFAGSASPGDRHA